MVSINKRAMKVVREIIENAEDLRCKVVKMDCGATIVDMGQECPGSWEAALLFTRADIGDLGIAGIPFETFAETGLRIKAESPLTLTFTISQANGGFGYLPTPAQHALGGYETWLGTSKVAVDSEPTIVSTLFQQLAELAAE